MKILLIEDDREMAADIVLTLRANGHEVETSGDGCDGMARARTGAHAALTLGTLHLHQHRYQLRRQAGARTRSHSSGPDTSSGLPHSLRAIK